MQIIERVAGRYEVEDVEFGTVYKWRPKSVVTECSCGERSTHSRFDLIGPVFTCECGADHTARIREELVVQLLEEDEAARPWRSSEDIGMLSN